MEKILDKIPTIAVGIAGYVEVQNLKEKVEDLENNFKIFMIIFSGLWVGIWLTTISVILWKIS